MQFMYIQRARDKSYVSEKGSISVTTPGLRRYYTEEEKSLLEDPLTLNENLLSIAQTWSKIKDYNIIKLLLRFNENIKLYLMAYLSRYGIEEINEGMVIEFTEIILKLFTVLEPVDIGYSNSKFKSFLFALNIKLVDIDISINEIKNDIVSHISKE